MNPRPSEGSGPVGELACGPIGLVVASALAGGSELFVHEFLATSCAKTNVQSTATIAANNASLTLDGGRKRAIESVLHAAQHSQLGDHPLHVEISV